MSFTLQPNLLDGIINDYTEGKLSTAELQSFSELKEKDASIRQTAEAGIRIRRLLGKLTDVKCRSGFDQRMAAKFALELEREVTERNKRNSGQPAVSS
jgi:hypothetical protein